MTTTPTRRSPETPRARRSPATTRPGRRGGAASRRTDHPAPPVLPGAALIGSALDLRDDYLGTLLRAADDLGSVVRIVAGPPGMRLVLYVLSDPDLVFEVLGHPERFDKDVQGYRVLREALGNGMLTSEDEVWHRQRRLLAPVFTPRRIATSYAATMGAESAALVQRWRAAAAAGTLVDAHGEMVDLTSRIIGRILFGSDIASAVPEIRRLRHVNDALLRRTLTPRPLPLSVPTPGNRRLSVGLRSLRAVVDGIIEDRRSRGGSAEPAGNGAPDGGGADDMLGLLLRLRDEDGDRLSDAEVADQILVFLLAGHDTTASTLACLLTELARSPHWQAVLREELREVLGDRPPTAADLPRLLWTVRCVREALRLYPAAHTIGRRAVGDEVLGGRHIPANASLVVAPWAVHRSERHWRDPHTFDPSRFDLPAGALPGGHRHAFFPFGAGPHACVGAQLAMTEAPIALATIMQTFTLGTELTEIPLRPAISLQPAAALPLRLSL